MRNLRGGKGQLLLAIQVVAFLALACSGNQVKPASQPLAVAKSSILEFTVGNSAETSMLLSDVSVSVFMASGEMVLVGKTGSDGTIRVPKQLLDPARAKLVLFCEGHFFCGALRADDPAGDLRKWDEYFLVLAPVVVR